MATYADTEDYNEFDPAFTVEDEAALEAVLVQAEPYIDEAVGLYARDEEDTGLKFIPADLGDFKARMLAMATCAQAEYIMLKGPEFFMNFQPERKSSGRGVIVEGRETYLAPKARMWLNRGNLFRLVGGKSTRRTVPLIPNQNIDQEPW